MLFAIGTLPYTHWSHFATTLAPFSHSAALKSTCWRGCLVRPIRRHTVPKHRRGLLQYFCQHFYQSNKMKGLELGSCEFQLLYVN
jgi:hypothetical protein